MADITYVFNDPTRPDLSMPMDLPPKPDVLDFAIDGYVGATPTLWTPEHEAACCYVTLCNGIKIMQKYFGRPVTKWAAVPKLYVQPRAGQQLNAFYDRQAIRLFYGNDPKLNKVVYTSNSLDVFCHELGHAILDAIRPDLFSTQAIEVWSFHEAFGDIHIIMNLLQHEFVIDTMLAQCGGDMRKPTFLSDVGEELGIAIYNSTRGKMGNLPNTLRSFLNTYTYVTPETLPLKGMDNQLTANPHSFSRVFSGAWFDILIGMYETYKGAMSSRDALIKARDTLAGYTYGALPIAPATIRFFDAMAKAMLVMDKGNKYEFNALMNKCFIARSILRLPVRPMLSMDWGAFKEIADPTDETFEQGDVSVLRTKNTQTFTLPEDMVNVQTPGDVYYEFNSAGECVDVIAASNSELLDHAFFCVDFLKANGMIRPDTGTPFEITKQGDLVRSYYSCGCGGGTGGCCFDNAHNPQAPEYLKGYKMKNNRGCGCNATAKSQCGANANVRITTGNLKR